MNLRTVCFKIEDEDLRKLDEVARKAGLDRSTAIRLAIKRLLAEGLVIKVER